MSRLRAPVEKPHIFPHPHRVKHAHAWPEPWYCWGLVDGAAMIGSGKTPEETFKHWKFTLDQSKGMKS